MTPFKSVSIGLRASSPVTPQDIRAADTLLLRVGVRVNMDSEVLKQAETLAKGWESIRQRALVWRRKVGVHNPS